MSSLDLHPEELLDKAAAGTLSGEERTRLEAHLKLCSVCRFEQQARADFAAEALALPQVDLDSMITNALAGRPAAPSANDEAPVLPRRRVSGIAPWAAASVMLFTMASFAAVARYTDVWPAATAVLNALIPAAEAPVAPAPVRRHSVKTEVPAALPPAPELETVSSAPDEAVDAPVASPVPEVAAAVEPVKEVPPAPRAAALVPSVPTSEKLFSQANSARISGSRLAAIAQYNELLQRFPTSAEARLSQAIVGRLLLDEGDAVSALTHFESYLGSPETGLREEALEARARALRTLGREREEAQAWRALLNEFPDGPYAGRAQSRLNAISE